MLTVHQGFRIGKATPADHRFNPCREIRRTGVTIITHADCEWFAWRPRDNIIVVNPTPGRLHLRGTVTLALAHRALGHWGNSLRQDIEARTLAAHWLIDGTAATWLAGICRCLTNLDAYRGAQCRTIAA